MREAFMVLCLGVSVAWAGTSASAQEKKSIALKVTVAPDGTVKVVDADTGKEVGGAGVIKIQAQGQGPGQIQIEAQGQNLDKKQLEQLRKEMQKLLQDHKPGDANIKVIKVERKQATGGAPAAGGGSAGPGGVEKKLDLILKQLDDLRKDVDGIKKKLDGKHADNLRILTIPSDKPKETDKAKKPDGLRFQFAIPDAKDPDKVKEDVRQRLEDAIKKLETDRSRVSPPPPVLPEAQRVQELQRAIDQLRMQIDELKKAKQGAK